jgi:DNA-binding CsgD family transcriptional regulator
MFDRSEPHGATAAMLLRSLGSDGSPLVSWNVELTDTVILLIHSGMLDEGGEFCQRRQDLARSSGRDSDYLGSLTGLTLIDWARGDLVGCEAGLRLGLEYPGGHVANRGVLLGLLSLVSAAKGVFDEAESLLDTAVSTGGLSISTSWRRGELAVARGRHDEAARWFGEAYDLHVARGTLNPAETLWVADFVEALAALGRRDEAQKLLADFTQRADLFGEPQAVGVARLAHGRISGGDLGIEYLERAVATLEPSPYRIHAARAQLSLGSALRRANRRTESRDHLRLALDYADRNGAVPLATRAREELVAAGGRPRRPALTGISALTPSERRIAGLAAKGMSNRDIASYLFVTVKTVEMHLGRSFEKLGIASRRDLGAVLQT